MAQEHTILAQVDKVHAILILANLIPAILIHGYFLRALASRDPGMWRGIGFIDVRDMSQHCFRSMRRAAAIKRNEILLMKVQQDKIELSWELARAHEELLSWQSWWEQLQLRDEQLCDRVLGSLVPAFSSQADESGYAHENGTSDHVPRVSSMQVWQLGGLPGRRQGWLRLPR